MAEKRTWLKSALEFFNIHLEKESCESPISSLSSESESDKSLSLLGEENCLDMKRNRAGDGLLWEIDKTSYDDEIINLHITHLQQIIKLRDQVENRENMVDDLWEELKSKDEELHNLKEFSDNEIYKLKAQIEESEARLNIHIPKRVCEITNLAEELEIANEKVKISEDENAVLRKEVESKSCETHELQDKLIEAEEYIAESDFELVSGRKHIQILEKLVRIYEQEVQKLKSEMLDSQDKFSLEKDELHFDIASLLKTKIELTSSLADCEFRNNELESKLKQYEAEILKQEEMHGTEKVLHDENSYVWEELDERTQDVEAVTMELDMVMMERDEANVKIDKLEAEICTLKFQLWNMNK
ncbi:uncharacterized protein LOC127079547 [Lathyrus oleraceus]|uniref:Uncharacterized protein n=1 Tax=Pisum sativum TaxID=3888 RepID=A0A9D4WPE2_PEA|nr:uncharacterized protein LOC127079547 [Pisum sativum]KAI5405450.1 hypothetical protein KIW84_052295 [Pisum sativum]